MIRRIAIVAALLAGSGTIAEAEGLDWSGSVGLGAVAASLGWESPGALDPAPLHMTDMRTAGAIIGRAAGEEAVSDKSAIGIGFTATISRGGGHLGHSGFDLFAELDLSVRMRRRLSHGLVLRAGAGGGIAVPTYGGTLDLSNENVVDGDLVLVGPVADVSIGYQQAAIGYALELRGAWLFEEHMTYMPLMLFAKVTWGAY